MPLIGQKPKYGSFNEHMVIDKIDEERSVQRLMDNLIPAIQATLASGGVREAFNQAAPAMVLELIKIASEPAIKPNEKKVKLAAIKDLLDRAGYNPVNKNANINVPEGQLDRLLESGLRNLSDEDKENIVKYLRR